MACALLRFFPQSRVILNCSCSGKYWCLKTLDRRKTFDCDCAKLFEGAGMNPVALQQPVVIESQTLFQAEKPQKRGEPLKKSLRFLNHQKSENKEGRKERKLCKRSAGCVSTLRRGTVGYVDQPKRILFRRMWLVRLVRETWALWGKTRCILFTAAGVSVKYFMAIRRSGNRLFSGTICLRPQHFLGVSMSNVFQFSATPALTCCATSSS